MRFPVKILRLHSDFPIHRKLRTTSMYVFWNLFPLDKKRPCDEEKQGLLGHNIRRISVVYGYHLHTKCYLTNQTNISFPLFSGFSVWVWTNSDIARRIKSEWLIWYLSHRVVISSLRTSGNLRQVWCGCFFISISFRHSEFEWSYGSLFPVFFFLLVY